MITITAVTGLRNRGVEALVDTTVRGLHGVAPDEEVVVLTRAVDFDRMHAGDLAVRFEHDPFLPKSPNRRMAFARERALRLMGRQPGLRARRLISGSRAVLASGGDCFSSDYGSISHYLEPLRVADRAGVPVIYFAQSIGPFRETALREEFKAAAREAALITVRESKSYHYCVDELGLDASRVEQTADPAFLLQPASEERVAQLRQWYGLDAGRPTLALAASQGLCNFRGLPQPIEPEALEKKHIECLAAVASAAVERLGCQVLIVPHVQESKITNDDRIVAQKVVEHLGWNPDIKIALGSHSASEFKGLIASCDLVVAERMHAAIAGLSSATPVCVVRYSVKADGITGDLLGDRAAETGALINFEDFLDPAKAVAAVERAWANREELHQTLAEKLPAVREQAQRTFTLIGGVLAAPAGQTA